jgi:ribosomal protein S18 acetylase RimI-like enzyme
MQINIIPFETEHANAFKNLNLKWLEKYFYVEDKDRHLLENCQESILDIGGHIFLAQLNSNIVGCFSLIPSRKKVFELGKMAVDPQFQGMRIGQQLLSFAIDFAKQHDWKAIVLYSSTKLDIALHLYRKYGFREVNLEKELPYERSDIKMELKLIG